jgi:hypothetical protein
MRKVAHIEDRRGGADVSGVIEAAQQINARRRDLQIRIKRARVAGDVDLAFQLIDELVPDSVLKAHEESHSTVASFNRSASRR